MDFLDPKKKQAHVRRLYAGYALVAIALAIATTILVFAASGFGVDRKTGEIIQNGLLFVDSHPQSSRILLNGEDRGETDNRYVLQEGAYSLELKREGYRSWKHNFDIEGGSVERYVYPFLFPEKFTTTTTREYTAKPDVVSASPDRHWIVSHVASAFRTMLVTDTSTKENKTTMLQIPASVLPDKPSQALEVVEWSTDNRHVLLKRTYEGGHDYLVFDRENAASTVNLTQALGKAFTTVQLRDKKHNLYYVHDAADNTLSTINLETQRLELVARKVLAFWPYEADTVLYVTDDRAPANKVLVRLKQGENTFAIRELGIGQKYLLNMAEFEGSLYVAVGADSDGRVYLYKDPYKDLKARPAKKPMPSRVLKVNNPQYLSFSNNARFVAVQGGSAFAVYDAERGRQYRYDLKLPIDATAKAEWMDGHRLTITSNAKLVAFDFDGSNQQTLVDVDAAFKPLFDRDYNMLFTVTPAKDGSAPSLMRTVLNLGELEKKITFLNR